MATMNDKRSTVIGVFEDRAHVVAAIRDLYQAGFHEDQIGIALRGTEGDAVQAEAASGEPRSTATGAGTTTGAVTGAVAGASLGGLVGLGIMVGMFPAIGLVVAGGTLAAILANAAGGAAIGGVLGSLTGDSYPQDEANYYQAEFEGRSSHRDRQCGRPTQGRGVDHISERRLYDLSGSRGHGGHGARPSFKLT